MSCLNLGRRLRPAKKAWKFLKTKLCAKLLMIHQSGHGKKTKIRPKTSTKSLPGPALAFQNRIQFKKRATRSTRPTWIVHCHRRSAPVYVDELFIKPALAAGCEKAVASDNRVNGAAAADEMWESLGLASPLMHGINERAEEFISRIRAEMRLQELAGG
ncbi:hypothetical protein NMG60_11014118 [Bertholletia excelsa]